MERRIYFGFANSLFIGIYIALYLLDGFSISFNVTFIGSNAFFMIVQFTAIGLDSIRVCLNLASICRDTVFMISNLIILFVLLTLDDT